MHPDTREVIVSNLRALVDEDPQRAMDKLEALLKYRSVRDLAEILSAVYIEISEELGIDWHFTALQWKLGNRGRDQILGRSDQPRFMVWSFAFQQNGDSRSETRYTTGLPFCFKPAWAPQAIKADSQRERSERR